MQKEKMLPGTVQNAWDPRVDGKHGYGSWPPNEYDLIRFFPDNSNPVYQINLNGNCFTPDERKEN